MCIGVQVGSASIVSSRPLFSVQPTQHPTAARARMSPNSSSSKDPCGHSKYTLTCSRWMPGRKRSQASLQTHGAMLLRKLVLTALSDSNTIQDHSPNLHPWKTWGQARLPGPRVVPSGTGDSSCCIPSFGSLLLSNLARGQKARAVPPGLALLSTAASCRPALLSATVTPRMSDKRCLWPRDVTKLENQAQ